MGEWFNGARSVLIVGWFAAASSPASFAATCNAATLDRLVNPRVVTTADTYEVSMRRSLSSTERADALFLKDALRKALVKDPSQVIELRGATYTPIVSCEGFRIVGMSVRKDNVSLVAAPPATLTVAPASAPAASSPVSSGPAPVAVSAASAASAALGASAGPSRAEEGVDRQRELTPRELTPRELTPRELTPRESTPRELTPRELSLVPQSKPQ
jgi:hypothetical protein